MIIKKTGRIQGEKLALTDKRIAAKFPIIKSS